MGLGLAPTFSTPWYSGSGGNADTPYIFQVAINGRGYIIDPEKYSRSTIPASRQPIDQSVEPGELSLNTEGLWRRSQENWVLGAGQEYFDNRASTYNLFARAGENQSLRYRFWQSKGVNPWNDGHLTLLPETEQKRSSTHTNLKLLAVNGYLYIADGNEVYFTADPTPASPSFTAANIIAGGAAITNVIDICTDGTNVYALLDDKRIQKTVIGASTSANLATMTGTAPGVIKYANGWLLATIDNKIFSVAAAGTLTQVGTDVFSTGFKFTSITGAPNAIYLAGSAGIHGYVYSLTINTSTGNLDIPIVATSLPVGETPNMLAYYGGYIILATSVGVRLSDISRSDNGLVYGPAVPISGGSQCLDAYSEYCWFGWSNMVSNSATSPTTSVTSTGLGRADLGRFTSNFIPAYASDLMATDAVTGTVTSVAYFNGRHYFAVSGNGFWGENSNKVATGFMQSGLIRFGTVEKKVLFAGDWRTNALPANATVGMIVMQEDGSFTTLATQTVNGSLGPGPLSTSLPVGEAFQVQMFLERSSTNHTSGPDLRRWTVRSLVTPQRMDEIIVPIMMKTEIEDIQGSGWPRHFDPLTEFQFLKSIEQDGTVVIYQEGSVSYSVYVDRVEVKPERWVENSMDRNFFNGTINVRLLTVPQ